MNPEEWTSLRSQLVLGQTLQGTVIPTPWPAGVTGIFVDLGLPVVGFVDGLLLPHVPDRWPTVGTVANFEIWWMDERPQIRLPDLRAVDHRLGPIQPVGGMQLGRQRLVELVPDAGLMPVA